MNSAESLRAYLGDLRQRDRPPDGARSASTAFLLAGAAVGALYPTALASDAQVLAQYAIGFAAATAIVIGTRIHDRARARTWYLIALSQLLFGTGMATYTAFEMNGIELGVPSLGDGLYLAGYPPVFAGLYGIVVRGRTVRPSLGNVIDAGIAALAFAAFTWALVLQPRLESRGLSGMQQVFAGIYPLVDCLVLGVGIWLFVVARSRPAALKMILSGMIVVALSNLAFALEVTAEGYVPGRWLDSGYIVSWALYGAAALHPSMNTIGERRSIVPFVRVVPHLGIYLSAGSLALIAGVIGHVWRGQFGFFVLLISCSIVLALVLARMSILVRGLELSNRALKDSGSEAEAERVPRRGLARARRANTSGAPSLTPREAAVLKLLNTQLSQREIGEVLFISTNTVKSHVASLYRKLGASSRIEAVMIARREGIL